MQNKVVLVYPKTGIYDTIIKDLPLSLLYAATIVHEKGYKVKIIDQRVEFDWKEKLLYELGNNPICVGISTMTGSPIKHALDISEIVKLHSFAPVVWGGIHPSLMPQQTLENKFVDLVINGDGEKILYELVDALANKKSLNNINGLSYKSNGSIYHNPPGDQIDLDVLPELPYELVNINNYYRKGYDESVISVMTSRGCPHKCAFCYAPFVSKRRWRKMGIEKTIQSIEIVIDKFHPGFICVLDDDFFIDLNRAKKIFIEIKRKNWNVNFDFRGVRVDDLYRMDNEMLSLLEAIGTRNLHIGAESGSQRILDLMRKGIKVNQTVEANRKLKNFANLHPTYNFFSGLPTETEEDIYKSTDLIFQLLRENPYCHMTVFNQFTPYPGSELYDMSIKYGYRPPRTLKDWGDFGPDNSARSLPWLNKRMIRLLDTLYITSYFIDKKLDIHLVSNKLLFKIMRLLINIYRPIARLRFKKHLTIFPLEIIFKDILFVYLKRKLKKEQGYFQTRLKYNKNRAIVWKEISNYLDRYIPSNSKILDLGAGYCDFINHIKAKEKYALDMFYDIDKHANKEVHVFKQCITQKINLDSNYLDVVFASNFFEHLDEETLDIVFREIKRILKNNGLLIIIQPNYKYYKNKYFQDPTHKLIFSDLSMTQFLERKGFLVEKNIGKFLPGTFKSNLPTNSYLVKLYLASPIKPLAKQFLILARNINKADK